MPILPCVSGAFEPPHPLDNSLLQRCRLIARSAGLFGVCLGVAVLVGGWVCNIATFRTVFPGYSAMRPNTALGLLLLGAALWLDPSNQTSSAKRLLAQIFAGLAALIGVVTLIEYVRGKDSIDWLMLGSSVTALAPGRMAVMTAVSFILLGGAHLLCRHRRGFAAWQYLVIATGCLCLFNAIGYVYGIKSFYTIAFHAGSVAMAIHTSLAFLILCAGVLHSRPDRGVMLTITSQSPGGVMARRLLPVALLIPIAAGWCCWRGQLLGFYDTAFGLTLFTAANVLIFGFFICQSSQTLNGLDEVRVRAERTVRESEVQFRALLESAPDALVILDGEGRIVLINARAEALFGYARQELLGEPVEILIPGHSAQPSGSSVNGGVELRGLRKDGSQFAAEITGSPIPTPHGPWICNAIRDITVRRDFEERLRESEDRYRTLVESLPQLVWTCLPDGRCDFLSRQWADYTGVSDIGHLGFGWLEQVHPEDRGNLQAQWKEALRTGDSLDVEYRLRNSQGKYRWFRALATPLRDESRLVTKWFGTSTEIESLKVAESALRDSEASFRQLADAMPQIVWTAKPDGSLDYYNQRWYDYTGMNVEQTKEWGWKPVLHPDDLQNTIDSWTKVLSTGELYQVEYRFKRASDGTYRWHLGRALPVLNREGEVTHWYGTCTDIEEYKQTDASIRSLNENLEEHVGKRTAELAKANRDLVQTKANLQGLLDAATQVAIIAVDQQGIIRVFNSGAEKMLQYSAAEVEGLHTPEIFHDAAECQERSVMLAREFGRPFEGVEVFVFRALQDKSEEREWIYVRKDGSRLDVSLAISTVRSSSGVVEGFLGIATDITARKALDRKLRVYNEKLIEQTRRAEQASTAKSEFLAAMSHEIRTPMNAILGMADVLWDSKLDADQRRYVEVFRRAGSNLLVLINDILDLSKIEAGHLELESVEFDLADVVDQVIELTVVQARAKSILLLSRLVPGLATALIGDPTRVRQILINLLGNAVKFTESGQVVLTVQSAPGGDPGEIEFAVSDTGIGIPSEKLETIFDNFTQADSSTTRKYGGTGLGLGISRRLVDSMGGRLTVISSIGEGSTFRFAVPFKLASPSNRTISVDPDCLRGRRVLVIEDNATSGMILRETLDAWGLQCDVFGFPQLAEAAFGEAMGGARPYELVLIDTCMPGIHGLEMSASLRRIAREIPILLLTADARPADRERRLETQLSSYTVKPTIKPSKRVDLLRLICAALKPPEGPATQPVAALDHTVESDQGLRILVAEDSSDNRLLVRAYLQGSPHRLTFAEDGQAAVDRFTAADFDLILMDIHMPVMDGLSATRSIRAIERERNASPIPIFALTANARPDDVEMSRQAGCNYHLSKPISKRKLLSLVEEYGSRRRLTETPVTASLQPIRVEMPSGLEEIVPGYLAARKQELAGMVGLLAISDFGSLAVLGHNIKGTGGSYGFPELTRMGAGLEDSANQENPRALTAQLAELDGYLRRVEVFSKA